MLLPQYIHPLEDNVDPADGSAPMITPADPVACPTGTTDTGSTVTLFDDGAQFPGGSANPSFPVCVLDNRITQSATFDNGHVYVLNGETLIGDGDAEDAANPTQVTITIEAGAQFFGREGVETALRFTRGADIDVQGTSDMPVVMSGIQANNFGEIDSDDDPTDLTGRGDWGGLVLNGFAQTNSDDAMGVPNEFQSEATTQTIFYGGNDDADSSGSINYLVIAESGDPVGGQGAEVQGLTLEAVGSGTSISNLQVIGSNDDGIEFFGGTVNVSNVVINGAEDDSLDMDQGYRGTVSNVIVRQAQGLGDHGIEADNNGDAPFDDTPVSRPNIVNGLFLIWGDPESGGALLREGFGGQLVNSVFADGSVVMNVPSAAVAGTSCFDNDDEVDENLNAFGVSYFCTNNAFEDDSDTFEADWQAGIADNGATVTFEAMEDMTISVDPASFFVTTSVSPTSNTNAPTAGNYMGAVPNSDAQAMTEFWRGWTVHFGQ